MRAWPANTGTSATPMIIQFFIISFYTISDMIEGLPSDSNVDLSFWQAACSGHLMCQRVMDTSKSVMRYVCECLCVVSSCQHALVSKSPLDQFRSVENESSALSNMCLLIGGFNASGLSVIDRCCAHFRPPAQLLPPSLKSLSDCLILTPPPHLTLNLSTLGGNNTGIDELNWWYWLAANTALKNYKQRFNKRLLNDLPSFILI